VVAAEDVGVDAGCYEVVFDALGAEPVVDTPAGVLFAGMEAVGPPGVDVGLEWMEMTECVDETGRKEFGEFLSLFIGEPGIHVVGLGVLQVYFLMSYVHISTDEDGFLLVELSEVETEGIVPRHAVGESAESVLRVWSIDRNNEEIGIFQCDYSAFGVHVGPAVVGHLIDDVLWQSVVDVERVVLGVDGCTAVAFLLGIVPVGFVARELQVELSLLDFCFLQTEEIRVECGKGIAEAFTAHGAESVYIP